MSNPLAKLREIHSDDPAVCALIDFVEAVQTAGSEARTGDALSFGLGEAFYSLSAALSEAVPESEGR
jgi:hypothetical protein